MSFVITCGDEGVQINEGTRLGFVGAGFHLTDFSTAVAALKKVLAADIAIAANEENDWFKTELKLSNWEQTNASAQQHVQAIADKEGLNYAGILPFADPKSLEHGVKGHMVRPHGIHIANKLCFTLAGGEQTYNLGNYIISAEWVAAVPENVAAALIKTQVDFYTKLAGQPLKVVWEEAGTVDPKIVAQNKAVLEKLGYQAS